MTAAAPATPPTPRLRPPEIAVDAATPFAHDKLGREPFVKKVVELIAAIREPFVIALNAPWGSGKTTTLKLLEPALAKAGVTAMSFNAWEVDDATDPLVPLVAAVHDRLLEMKGYGEGVTSTRIETWKKAGVSIIKQGAIAAVKVVTAGVVDAGAIADGVAKAAGEAVSKAGEGVAGDLVDVFKRERRAAQHFRELLREMVAYLRATAEGDADPPPLVLVIDELDRCRPTFAVAMLERIKHFFDVEGLVFLLAVDLEQLKASTCKVYGEKLDATEYLRRFVDLELALPPAPVGLMVDAMLTACGADSHYEPQSRDREWVVEVIEVLARHFGLSLRVVQRMVTRLMLVLRQTPKGHYTDSILTAFMIFLRLREPALLRALVAERIEAGDLMQQVSRLAPGGAVFYRTHAAKIIEAHVLIAHRDQEYVLALRQRADALGKDASQAADAESIRLVEMGQYYEQVRRENFSRGSINLARIDERINLVTMDLKDER